MIVVIICFWCSCWITNISVDIGEYSMSPIEMIKNLGYSENLFTKDGFNIKRAKKD